MNKTKQLPVILIVLLFTVIFLLLLVLGICLIDGFGLLDLNGMVKGHDGNITGAENYTYMEGIASYRPWNVTQIKIINALPHLPWKVVSTADEAIEIAEDEIERSSKDGSCNLVLVGVFYDSKDQIWIVTYVEPEVATGNALGGDINVAISKNNGKIIEAWAED